MGELKQLFKDKPHMSNSSFYNLVFAFKEKDREKEELYLQKIYLNSNDPLTILLVVELMETKGYVIPEIEEPKSYA